MAETDELKAGAIALQRFGLGPKPGQGEAARAQIRDRLLAEIAAGSVAQPEGVTFSSAAEIGKALYEAAERGEQVGGAWVAGPSGGSAGAAGAAGAAGGGGGGGGGRPGCRGLPRVSGGGA